MLYCSIFIRNKNVTVIPLLLHLDWATPSLIAGNKRLCEEKNVLVLSRGRGGEEVNLSNFTPLPIFSLLSYFIT